jgi:hypothetical protein
LWSRPRPRQGCGAKEEEEEEYWKIRMTFCPAI